MFLVKIASKGTSLILGKVKKFLLKRSLLQKLSTKNPHGGGGGFLKNGISFQIQGFSVFRVKTCQFSVVHFE